MTDLEAALFIATGIAAWFAAKTMVRYGRTMTGPNQMVLGSAIMCVLLAAIIVGWAGL